MEYPHYAAIDIGSNAVRLLVKRLDDDATGRFSKDVKKLKNLTNLMRAFSIVMGIYEVNDRNRRICATCALREASNSAAVVKAVREATDLDIEIISGQEEAGIVCGLSSPDDKRKLVYVDVGGGSTEVSIMSGGKTFCSKSYPIGTVKMINSVAVENWKERLVKDLRKLATDFAMQNMSSASMTNATIVGAGGNINKLFSLAGERDAAGQTMSVDELRILHTKLASLSVEQRMAKYKLKADRADVIVPAAEIFITIADALGISEIEIPTDGLADGIIFGIWQKQKHKQTL